MGKQRAGAGTYVERTCPPPLAPVSSLFWQLPAHVAGAHHACVPRCTGARKTDETACLVLHRASIDHAGLCHG
eukprot:6358573-Pyramimonas_sp.AAC.1